MLHEEVAKYRELSGDTNPNTPISRIGGYLDGYEKALEQEHCEDEYIKVPKKALKYRTAGMVAYNVGWLKNHFDIERAVICGAQQSCGDAISRQAVLDEISDYNNDLDYTTNELYDRIKRMSSVNPQPKTGHWVDTADEINAKQMVESEVLYGNI